MDNKPNDKGPLHPALGNKVVHMADVLAWRQEREQREQLEQDLANGQDPFVGLSTKQRAFWVNQRFFADRLAGEDTHGYFGRLAFEVGDLVLYGGDPQLVLEFNSEAVHAFFLLTDALMINWEFDPIVVRWSCVGDSPYPVHGESAYTFTKRT